MSRSKGERVRLVHAIARMRASLASVEQSLAGDWVGPIGAEAAEAMLTSAGEIAMQIAKLDAFTLVETDEQEKKHADWIRTSRGGT